MPDILFEWSAERTPAGIAADILKHLERETTKP